MPSSKLKVALAKLLVEEGWLEHYEEKELPGNKKELSVTLKYAKSGNPVISHVSRVSKPSRRVYVNKDQLPVVRNGLGVAIISTSQGLMTQKQADEQSVGGEYVCDLY